MCGDHAVRNLSGVKLIKIKESLHVKSRSKAMNAHHTRIQSHDSMTHQTMNKLMKLTKH